MLSDVMLVLYPISPYNTLILGMLDPSTCYHISNKNYCIFIDLQNLQNTLLNDSCWLKVYQTAYHTVTLIQN